MNRTCDKQNLLRNSQCCWRCIIVWTFPAVRVVSALALSENICLFSANYQCLFTVNELVDWWVGEQAVNCDSSGNCELMCCVSQGHSAVSPFWVGHSLKDPHPVMGSTQSRLPSREASRVTTKNSRRKVLVVSMSLTDVAARIQLRREDQPPWLLAPVQEVRSHGDGIQSASSPVCQVSSSVQPLPVTTVQSPTASCYNSTPVRCNQTEKIRKRTIYTTFRFYEMFVMR